MVVYKITNTVNNKIYIGCTSKSIEARWSSHVNSRFRWVTVALSKAIIKYGKEAFIIKAIEEVETKKEMFDREIYWISFYNSRARNIGYNMTDGGDSGPISRGMDNPRYGKSNPMISEYGKAMKGKTIIEMYGEERAAKISKAIKDRHTGKIVSDAIKKRMSDAHKIFNNKNPERFASFQEKGRVANIGRISHRRKAVLCVTNNRVYDSITEAAFKLNLERSCIRKQIRGELTKTGGYAFHFLSEDHLIF